MGSGEVSVLLAVLIAVIVTYLTFSRADTVVASDSGRRAAAQAG